MLNEDELKQNLRDAVAALAAHYNTKSPNDIRGVVEEELEINIDPSQENTRIIDTYAHTFYGLDQERLVDRTYLRGFMSNLMDAARGKRGY